MTTLYPIGYGSRKVSLETLIAEHGSKMHPEFARRFFAMVEASNGLLGIGGGWRSSATQAANYARDPKTFAPAGRSFHETKTFASGIKGYQAIDTVGIDGRHSEAWAWMAANCERFGLREFSHVNNEAWHVQCRDIPNSVRQWEWAGKPDPSPDFVLPDGSTIVAPPSTPSTPATPAPTRKMVTVTLTLPELVKGSDAKSQVLTLQALLNTVAGQGVTVDGDFGNQTDTAVRNVQSFLKLKVDGRVGPITWKTLLEA